ncbi:MAG: VOC family protein [Dysgonomonas mossii]|uniref:VOC family protein n=1 Tax=Dysgonomonas mossii TaxID=163665 RepID=UPI001DB4EBCC|nr:VOC family protein [Dysgonomonas mossii]MBS5796533.1 VOC family protein [Dysgonomonas mossii]MBS7111779.1 VOC family protein [Dysgonomonas mossii]
MKKQVAFFEIPSVDFNRAVKFYELVLGISFNAMDFGHEKMAFFPEKSGKCPGAISYTPDFNPSKDGVLISFSVESIETSLDNVVKSGGKRIIPKTKIEAEGVGYFATFIDSEGNSIGLYSDK